MNCDYCSSCGGKVEYLLNKPNFCPSCGAPFGESRAVARKAPSPIRHKTKKPISSDEDAEGTDINYVPNMRGLQYEIEGGLSGMGRNHGTIGDMFKNSDTGETPFKSNQQSKPQSSSKATANKKGTSAKKKPNVMPDAIKQSMKDCGSSADTPVDVD